jgi:hypothetical protein
MTDRKRGIMAQKITVELIKETIGMRFDEENKDCFDCELKTDQDSNLGDEFIIATHPGVGYFYANLTVDNQTADEWLNDLAHLAWPGEGDWPENDGDYPAYVLNMGNRTISMVKGGCEFYSL